jgi:SOS-response transcriptional repressor LexA
MQGKGFTQGEMMEQITDTQMRIVQFICSFADQHGYQPSYRQIANHFNWSSLGYIAYVIRRLKTKGLVESSGPRAVVFTGDWRAYVTPATDAADLPRQEPTW